MTLSRSIVSTLPTISSKVLGRCCPPQRHGISTHRHRKRVVMTLITFSTLCEVQVTVSIRTRTMARISTHHGSSYAAGSSPVAGPFPFDADVEPPNIGATFDTEADIVTDWYRWRFRMLDSARRVSSISHGRTVGNRRREVSLVVHPIHSIHIQSRIE